MKTLLKKIVAVVKMDLSNNSNSDYYSKLFFEDQDFYNR